MSSFHRYIFTKETFKGYLVILIKNNRYYSYGNDDKILKYLKFKNNLNVIRKRKINYLILDNLDIIEKKEYDKNEFDKYLYLVYIINVLDSIKDSMKSNIG